MKRLILLLLIAIPAISQSTTTSTTGVIDPDGFTWSAGTYQITFVPNPSFPSIQTYVWTGGNLQQNNLFTGVLNGSGAFSQSLPSNTAISPSGSQWKFTICPNASSGCFSANTPVSGATLDITANLNAQAKAPRFADNPVAFGYGIVEVNPIPLPGAIFFNTTTGACLQYGLGGYQSCSVGGVGVPGGTLDAIQYNAGGIFGGASFNGFVFSSTSAPPRAAVPSDFSAAGVVLTNPAGNQTIVQPPGTSLGINNLNGELYVNQWCTTPGVLDDTCFSNAIAQVIAHGPIGTGGHRMGVLLVSPGTYNWRSSITTVTIPAGVDIGIVAPYITGTFGSVVNAGAANQTFFTVLADGVEISNLAFNNTTPFSGIVGVQLGNATTTSFDDVLKRDWFLSITNFGIHPVNASGALISETTCDSGTQYCVYSNQSGGDILFNDSIIRDMVGFGGLNSVFIDAASPAVAYSNNQISGEFYFNTGTGVSLLNTLNTTVSGQFSNNTQMDISTTTTVGTNIGPFTTLSTGGVAILASGDTSINIHDGSITDSGVISSPTPLGAIELNNCTSPSIVNVNSHGSGAAIFNTYGLAVVGSSTNSTIIGNSFNSQLTAAYNINGVQSPETFFGPVVVDNEAIAGTVTLFSVGQQFLTNPKLLLVQSMPAANTFVIQGVQAGVGNNQTIALNPGGGPVTVGGSPIPVVNTPTVGQAACIKAAGPPVVIGFCSTVVSALGACTCN